jgi:hypothetical protein
VEKLCRIESREIDLFAGYLEAAGYAFRKGQCDVTLDAHCLEILDPPVNDWEVVIAAYGSSNEIQYRAECSLDAMIARVHELLTVRRQMFTADYCGIPGIIEQNLRDGYWSHLAACFDYRNARIAELGPHVPWVNIGRGFTFVLYAPDMSACALLVGNQTD